MKEDIQIELLKLAVQTVNDLEKNKSNFLLDLKSRADAACNDKAVSGFEKQVKYLYQYYRALIAASAE